MGITDSFPRTWQCVRCTYVNSFTTSLQCGVCGADRDEKLWICCKCGASNPIHIVLCNSCGSEQNTFTTEKIDWPCPKCSYANFSETTKCAVCKSDKRSNHHPAKSKDPVAIVVDTSRLGEFQDDALKCHKCQTLLYDNIDAHCMVCNTPCMAEAFKPRPFPQSSLPKVKHEDHPSSSGVWKCGTCTLLNDPGKTICQACGTKKGDKNELRKNELPLGR